MSREERERCLYLDKLIGETMVRERSRTAMGRGVGENNKLGTRGRQNAGLDHHVGTEEEQRAEDDGAST